MNSISLATGVLLLGGAVQACAHVVPLQVEASASSIRSAEEQGAAGVPQAALHLQLAKEELAEATALNEDRRDDEAKSMLLRAEADADLAVALSRASSERAEAEAAVERVRVLRTQGRSTQGGAN